MFALKNHFAESSRIRVALAIALILVGVALTAVQYANVKRSFFDDTFIYLNVAQNAVELGTWQYFPIVDRPALVASSPLRAIVLTVATAVAWPFTDGERSLRSAAIILPLSTLVTALLFFPFWLRDKYRFLLLCVPYVFLAATLDSINEFEAGLIYWWVLTVMRDFAERRSDFLSSVAVVLGPFVRPDIALVGVLILLLSHQARSDLLRPILRRWTIAALPVVIVWVSICFAMHVWPIPTTYWTKAALPKLFDTTFMVSFFFDRMGRSALGTAPWSSQSFASALGLTWTMLIVVIAARSVVLRRWRLIAVILFVMLLLSRTPANFWWYYQNALVAFVAIALASSLLFTDRESLSASIVLLVSVFACLLPSKALREPNIMWHFDQPSRAQGYLAMANTFASDGTIELPGLGRGYLTNPEIGITSYFGGKNAWIWDTGGLAQAQPAAMGSVLRFFYPKRLRELPEVDVRRLQHSSKSAAEITVFSAWATENRSPAYDIHGKCTYMLFDRAVCVTGIDKRPRNQ
jgi:hypothetical protein